MCLQQAGEVAQVLLLQALALFAEVHRQPWALHRLQKLGTHLHAEEMRRDATLHHWSQIKSAVIGWLHHSVCIVL